jgi:spore photoproduct lyase
MLNVEEWMERVDQLLADNPWQKVIRFDVETDCLILEPEYGICRDLVEHFAELDDRYLILFSKSDNVDFLLDLEHRGHTIMLWTLSTPIVSRRIEVDTATTEERIEAARKCQAAGYPVRFKFKPIVPTRNWRQDATDMLEKLFAAVQPDNLSMETLFFRNTEELKSMFDEELLDPDFVRLMEEHEAEHGIDDPYKSIPEPFRIEIYEHYAAEVKRLSPQTPISLCAESATAWEHMAPLLGQTPYDFICNCGPACIPYLKPSSMVNAPDFKPTIAPQ